MGEEIRFPEMPRQYKLTRGIPDHEVLLVFEDDDDAEQFRDWLQVSGWAAFGQYVDGGSP